jgi:hypothetical protein
MSIYSELFRSSRLSRRLSYKSTLDAITKIVEKEGVEGLYSGIVGSLIGVASTNFAYFYL